MLAQPTRMRSYRPGEKRGMKDWMRALSLLIFKMIGWRTEGAPPPSHRCVLIAAPHTSNWDAVIMLLAGSIFQIKLTWFIKKSWFFFPLGLLLRRIGGIPIDRGTRHGVVERAIEQFARGGPLIMAVPP